MKWKQTKKPKQNKTKKKKKPLICLLYTSDAADA